jgi:hypothetical protein
VGEGASRRPDDGVGKVHSYWRDRHFERSEKSLNLRSTSEHNRQAVRFLAALEMTRFLEVTRL